MHETTGYVRVKEPGRRSSSNIRTMLIIGVVVAVLILIALVVAVAVALGVELSKGIADNVPILISPPNSSVPCRLRFHTRVLVCECSQQHGHFGQPLRRLLPVQLRWVECSQPFGGCRSDYTIWRSCYSEYGISTQCNREWQRR